MYHAKRRGLACFAFHGMEPCRRAIGRTGAGRAEASGFPLRTVSPELGCDTWELREANTNLLGGARCA